MLIVMKQNATADDVDQVVDIIKSMGLQPHAIPGRNRTAIGITGNKGPVPDGPFTFLPGVAQAIPVSQPFKLVSLEAKGEASVVSVDGVAVGGRDVVVMAGPCSVESREQLMACAHEVKKCGATFLRGGAFKPRTSPYDFQGLGQGALELLDEARRLTGLKVVTEVVSTDSAELVARYADLMQVGARNMQNFALLRILGEMKKPVLLKRGMAATIKELLMAAEYIAASGNYDIILCERGIRTFETMTRNTLDLGAVTVLKELSHLPVIVDPSHGIGRRSGVGALARAGIAVGADGIIVEMHPNPAVALSDGPQSLTFPMFDTMMGEVRKVAGAVGRSLS